MSTETSEATLTMSATPGRGVIRRRPGYGKEPLFSEFALAWYCRQVGPGDTFPEIAVTCLKVLAPYVQDGELPASNLQTRALEPVVTYPIVYMEPKSPVDLRLFREEHRYSLQSAPRLKLNPQEGASFFPKQTGRYRNPLRKAI